MIENDWVTEYVEVDGCRLAFHDIGATGHPLLVFVHGIGTSKEIWTPVIRRLPTGWRFVPMDIRGGGESEETDRRPLTLAGWTADLAALVDHFHVDEPPILVGHSLGASIVLQYALDYPRKTRALVMLGAEGGLCRLGPLMRERAKTIEESGLEAWAQGPWRNAPPVSVASRRANPSLVDEYATMLYETGADRYIRCVDGIAESPDLTDRLGEIRVPALVLIGGEDDRTLPEHGWTLANGLPQGRGAELAEVGHTLHMENPEGVASEIGDFVTDVVASTRAGT